MNDVVERFEPAGEPAWPIYRRIILERFGIDSEDEPWRPTSYFKRLKATLGWDGEAIYRDGMDLVRSDGLRTLVARSAGVFEALTEAARRPRMGKHYVRDGTAITGEQDPTAIPTPGSLLLPETAYLGQLAALSLAAARESASQDDWTGFEDRLASAFAIGAHSGRVASMAELHGVASRWMTRAAREAVYSLNESAIPSQTASAIDERLRFDSTHAVCVALELERLHAHAMLESLFTREGDFIEWRFLDLIDGGRRETPDGEWIRPHDGELPESRAPYPSFEETKAAVNQWFTALIEAVDDPDESWVERTARARAVETENKIARRIVFPMERVLAELGALERDLRATRLMLRLERVHAETGAWPASLDAPELAELTEDPVTGEPFGYQRTPDDPHGRPYGLTAPETSLAWIEGGELNPPRPELPEGE